MKNVLLDVAIDAASMQKLAQLSAVRLHTLPSHDTSVDWPADILRDCHILLCKWPPANFDDLAVLELLQISTVGYEHLRHLKLGERPLQFCNARGMFDTSIAEWTLAMMVNLTRDLRGMIRRQEYGAWERPARFQQEMRGRTVGIWGYGGIGRETARLAKAFGLSVHVMTRSGVGPRRDAYTLPETGDPDGMLPDRVFTTSQERNFLAGLDFLVLAVPRTNRTDGMIGPDQLRALPPRAFVLNPARGPIIQEQALLQALREGWIAGAGLDTHYTYPMPPDHPLWRFPNVILTPHISGADHTPQFPGRIGDLFVQNVERHLNGRALLNLVTAEEWQEV